VRNFNDNAADTKRHSTGSIVRRRQNSADEVNKNWNAGDAEEAEPAVEPVVEEAAEETTRKVSITLPPSDTGDIGKQDDEDDEEEEDSDFEEIDTKPSPSQEKIAKLRRLSAIADASDDGESPKSKRKQKRRPSIRRPCIRRCIAEDETWNLKTVPDLVTLIIDYFVDNYAGTIVWPVSF